MRGRYSPAVSNPEPSGDPKVLSLNVPNVDVDKSSQQRIDNPFVTV